MALLMKSKNIVIAIILLGVVIGAAVWQVSKIKLKADTKHRVKQDVSDMIAQHNAFARWDECFTDYEKKIDGGHRGIYTIDVETALIRNDNRPILFYGYVADVKKVDEKYIVIFATTENVDIDFVLRCNAEQAKKILGQPMEYPGDCYAVVAAISNIERPKFEVDAYQDGEYEPYILVEPGDTFVAHGACVDLLFVGDYTPSND
jgi:hypothetical protein